VHQSRQPLENVSGAVIALSLAAASVQVFNLLTPDRGLLHVLFGTFFFVQLLSTIAGTSDRRALLRSLTVLLGSAFILRYIVLESVYARTGGTLARILTVLMEGVSLGALQYEPNGPATGYLAFAALSLYLIALFLLEVRPSPPVVLTMRDPRPGPHPRTNPRRSRQQALRMLIVVALVGGAACRQPPLGDAAAGPVTATLVPAAVRDRTLEAARAIICCAISLCGWSPRPESPMTANRTEPSSSGRASCPALVGRT
jgi:hypothetical protein